MTPEEIRAAILEKLQERQRISGGHNGTYVVGLLEATGLLYEDIKPILNDLYSEKKIRVSEGSKGKLILLRKKNIVL